MRPAQDYAAFFGLEAAERRELEYPPYGHLVEVEVRGKVKERVIAGVGEIKRVLARAASGSEVSILGPAPKPLSRIKGMERWHLLLRSTSRRAIRDLLDRGLPATRGLRLPGVHVAIDVDPRQLL